MKLLSAGNDANDPAPACRHSLERDLSYNLNLHEDLRRNLPQDGIGPNVHAVSVVEAGVVGGQAAQAHLPRCLPHHYDPEDAAALG